MTGCPMGDGAAIECRSYVVTRSEPTGRHFMHELMQSVQFSCALSADIMGPLKHHSQGG
ncbi:hypothetical protein PATSB16_07180 [Pandoraea thiooxydans]|nr:hypothetical protein PATSB16_07180 [Pandoraea thiooxydans]